MSQVIFSLSVFVRDNTSAIDIIDIGDDAGALEVEGEIIDDPGVEIRLIHLRVVAI